MQLIAAFNRKLDAQRYIFRALMTKMLKGGFVQTDKNLYADLVKISIGVRGGDWSKYRDITAEIKNFNDKIKDKIEDFELEKLNVESGGYARNVVESDDSDRDPNVLFKEMQDKAEQEFKKTEEIFNKFNKEERPKLEEKIRSLERDREKFGAPISIQVGDIFPEIRVEMINGKTVINLEANPYPHDLIKSVGVGANLGPVEILFKIDKNVVMSAEANLSGKNSASNLDDNLKKTLEAKVKTGDSELIVKTDGSATYGVKICRVGVSASTDGTTSLSIPIGPINGEVEANIKDLCYAGQRCVTRIAEGGKSTGPYGQSESTDKNPMQDNFDSMSEDERDKGDSVGAKNNRTEEQKEKSENSERLSNKKAA